MVSVTIERQGSRHILTARGHAVREERPGKPRRDGGREHDSGPEVCAAVSGLLYALAGYLTNLENARGRGWVRLRVCAMEGGYSYIDAEGMDDVEAAFDMAEIGLRQIERRHPGRLRVDVSG